MPASLIHPFDSMARPGGHGEISVLITSPFPGDHQYFTEVLSQPDIRVLRALNLRQAEPQIRSLPVAVVITEKELPDGTWKATSYQEQRCRPGIPAATPAPRGSRDVGSLI